MAQPEFVGSDAVLPLPNWTRARRAARPVRRPAPLPPFSVDGATADRLADLHDNLLGVEPRTVRLDPWRRPLFVEDPELQRLDRIHRIVLGTDLPL